MLEIKERKEQVERELAEQKSSFEEKDRILEEMRESL